LSLGLLAFLGIGVVGVLVRYWGANPEYADRFLIVLAAGWAMWTARNDLAQLPAQPLWFGTLVLLLGAVLFPIGWFLQASAAPRTDTTWWVTVSWIINAAGVVLLVGGRKHLRRLAFPLVFLLFALPIPARIHNPLQAFLQIATTSVAAATLPALGVPVVQQGYVLSLPGGDLGVVEACSGVRSVTALTAIAAFVAYHQGLGLVSGSLMLAFSVPLIAAVNAVRVILSALIQEHFGSTYIQGHWHDALGIAMILVGLLVVVGLAKILRPRLSVQVICSKQSSSVATTLVATAPTRSEWPARVAVSLLAITLILTVTAQIVAIRTIDHDDTPPPHLETIPLKLGPWIGEEMPVPVEVAQELTADEILHRKYSHFGYEAHVWIIYWTSHQMTKGYHHPDICWPNRGFQQRTREVSEIQLLGGGNLPITTREFVRGRERQIVLYWTQEGRQVWTEQDEIRAQHETFGHEVLFERLFQPLRQTGGRLTVLIGSQSWGDGVEVKSRMLDLSRRVADELYNLCPWAKLEKGLIGSGEKRD
jgi:EpsI family protein